MTMTMNMALKPNDPHPSHSPHRSVSVALGWCTQAKREDGQFEVSLQTDCAIFKELPETTEVLLTHGDSVAQLPDGFRVTCTSGDIIAGIECAQKRFYGVQFHPEVDLTPRGMEMMKNFLYGVCGLSGSFSMASREQIAIKYIRETVGEKQAIPLHQSSTPAPPQPNVRASRGFCPMSPSLSRWGAVFLYPCGEELLAGLFF